MARRRLYFMHKRHFHTFYFAYIQDETKWESKETSCWQAASQTFKMEEVTNVRLGRRNAAANNQHNDIEHTRLRHTSRKHQRNTRVRLTREKVEKELGGSRLFVRVRAYFSSDILMTGESRHKEKSPVSISRTDSLLSLSVPNRRNKNAECF